MANLYIVTEGRPPGATPAESGFRSGGAMWPPVLLMTIVLLIGVITRLPTLVNNPMWWDEVWTMWQTQGTLVQAIQLTPYNWPPGYYALMQIWTSLVGHNDIIGRYFSLLCGLLSIALMYRIGQTLVADRRTGRWIGFFAALLTAVLPYTTYLTIEARGYALFAVAIPLTLWLHIRWLRRPSVRRSIGYGLALAFCLYSSYTGLLVIGFSLGHSLLWAVIDRRRARNVGDRSSLVAWGVALGVLILCAIPMVLNLISIVQLRRQNIADHLAPPGIDNLPANFVSWLAGGQPIAFGLISAVALIGLLLWLTRTQWRSVTTRDWRRVLSFLAIWAIIAPIIMVVFRYYLLLVALRYMFYVVPGIILVIALGLSRWPRLIRLLISVPILIYIVSPIPLPDYRPVASDAKPIRDTVRELGKRYQVGDSVWFDPKCNCGAPIEWSYYESVYFPGGLIPRITDLAQAGRRVWYISDQRTVSSANLQTLAENRSHTEFFGPYYLIADLYEAPPRSVGLPFGPDLHYYGADFPRIHPAHPGDNVSIRLWWSIAAQATQESTVTLTIYDPSGKRIIAQSSAPPQGIPAPLQPIAKMTDWQPNKIYVDERTFTLPSTLTVGDYPVRLTITDPSGKLVAPDPGLGDAPGGMLLLGALDIFNT